MAAPPVIYPARRSDTFTFEKTLATGTSWVELYKAKVVAVQKLCVYKVEVEGAGEVQIQLLDVTKEKTTDLNTEARKIKFFPLTFPIPVEVEKDHEFVVNGMQGYGYSVEVRGRIEVSWVR